jgi:hypothetical protein
MTTSSVQILTAGLTTACLLAVTRCGNVETTAPPQPAPSVSATAASPPTPSDTDPTSTRPASSAPPGQSPERPFRTLYGAFEGVAVTAEVYPIRRTGPTSSANVRFTVANGSRTFRILTALNDHNPEIADKGSTSPDGLRLIDPTAKKAYLPATIGDRECLCSPAVNDRFDRYTDVTVSVSFAAPPVSRTTINLVLPGFGTVADVPLH